VEYHKQCYEKYMCKRFPQLVFHRPKLWNKSEIVYAECLSQASVTKSFMDDMETSQSSHKSLILMLTLEQSIHIHKCNIEKNVYSCPNIEKQLA
jgi:hypothetical protein